MSSKYNVFLAGEGRMEVVDGNADGKPNKDTF